MSDLVTYGVISGLLFVFSHCTNRAFRRAKQLLWDFCVFWLISSISVGFISVYLLVTCDLTGSGSVPFHLSIFLNLMMHIYTQETNLSFPKTFLVWCKTQYAIHTKCATFDSVEAFFSWSGFSAVEAVCQPA